MHASSIHPISSRPPNRHPAQRRHAAPPSQADLLAQTAPLVQATSVHPGNFCPLALMPHSIGAIDPDSRSSGIRSHLLQPCTANPVKFATYFRFRADWLLPTWIEGFRNLHFWCALLRKHRKSTSKSALNRKYGAKIGIARVRLLNAGFSIPCSPAKRRAPADDSRYPRRRPQPTTAAASAAIAPKLARQRAHGSDRSSIGDARDTAQADAPIAASIRSSTIRCIGKRVRRHSPHVRPPVSAIRRAPIERKTHQAAPTRQHISAPRLHQTFS